MGPNGCGCHGNGMTNGNPFAFDIPSMQRGGMGMQPGMSGGSFLLDGATVDLSALRSPANLEATPVLVTTENLTSCIRDGLTGR